MVLNLKTSNFVTVKIVRTFNAVVRKSGVRFGPLARRNKVTNNVPVCIFMISELTRLPLKITFLSKILNPS